MKKILSIITAIAIIAIGVLTAYTIELNSTTAFSSACKITPAFRDFVIQEFGDNDSVESLIVDVNEFIAQKEYVYKKGIIQHFDCNEFVRSNFSGCCYDWSIFLKIVVREISLHKNWTGITPLVTDAESLIGEPRHSFNYIKIDNADGSTKIYFTDVTINNTRRKNQQKLQYYVDISPYSMEEYAIKFLNYKIINYH